jgi:hypothetical protein
MLKGKKNKTLTKTNQNQKYFDAQLIRQTMTTSTTFRRMMAKRRPAKKKVSETAAHRQCKEHIASELRRALAEMPPNAGLRIDASLQCDNARGGAFFPCASRINVPAWLTLESSANLSARTEFVDGSSRFDVALVRTVPAPVPLYTPPSPLLVPSLTRQAVSVRHDDPVTRALQAKLDGFLGNSTAHELVVVGSSFERLMLHELAERAGLVHVSEGSGVSRVVVLTKKPANTTTAGRRRKAAFSVNTTVSTVDKTVAVFEILHTTPMTDAKVSSLNVPWIELSTRDAETWRAGTPLKCVASSLGPHLCSACARDPTQSEFVFDRVLSVVDVFDKRFSVSRHLFAQLRRQVVGRDDASYAVVQYPMRLLSQLWLPVPPVQRLVDVPATSDGGETIASYLADKVERFRQRSAHVDVRLAQPTAPRDLFPQSDVIASERDWHRPQALLVSLDRVFGIGWEWRNSRRRRQQREQR